MKTKKQEISWTLYTKTSTVKLDGNSKEIIKSFGKINDEFFSNEKDGENTCLIKKTLLHLGHKLKLKVGGHFKLWNNCQPIIWNIDVRRELLFDLQWYQTGEEKYSITSLELAMECEWKQNKNKEERNNFLGIKYDFQKLLMSNAKLRLMIFKIKHEDDLEILGAYFEKMINGYEQLEKNAQFLFVAFDSKQKSFHYKEIIKK